MAMFPVIEVSGSAFERGRIHGERARGRVERSLANYARLFAFVGLPWREAQRRATPFRDVIGNFDAALLEEIEGIAKGAGRPFAELLTLNVRTEVLPPSFLTGADDGECTAIVVSREASATGEALLAQNWDWVGSQRDSMVLLRVEAGDAPACVTLTEAGMLGKIGLNELGFAVGLNIIRSVHDHSAPGVPVHVLLRALLKRRSVRDATITEHPAMGRGTDLRVTGAGIVGAALEVGGAIVHLALFRTEGRGQWPIPYPPFAAVTERRMRFPRR